MGKWDKYVLPDASSTTETVATTETESTESNKWDKFVAAEPGQKDSPANIAGVAGKAALSAIANAPSEQNIGYNALNPVANIADKILQSAYQESKRPILDASPFQGKVARTAQSVGIDILAAGLAETGVVTAKLSNSFLKTKPFLSDKALISNIVKHSEKIYDETSRLLRPQDLAEYIGVEKNHPAVIEVSNLIRKSKDPKTVISKINQTVDHLFSTRKEYLVNANRLVNPTHLKHLEKYIDQNVANGTITNTQEGAMRNVLAEESSKLNPKKFDLLSAETKKEFYQGMAKRVYNAGGMDELTTGINKAYTVLAQGAKEVVEDVVPYVKPINKRYEGLVDARDMLARLQKKLIENPNETLNVVADTIGRPSKKGMVAAAIRKIPVVRDWGTYKHTAGKIEKLNTESEALRGLLNERIKRSISK